VANAALMDGESRVTPLTYAHAALAPTKAAVQRMLTEATEMGADGVVNCQIQHTAVGHGVWECTVTGTAVRARGARRSKVPFVTTLSGADTAKLLGAGYVPATVAVGMTIGIVHDLLRAQAARSKLTTFREIPHITQLVHVSRLQTRRQIVHAVTEAGADGAILTSQMTVELDEHRVGANHHDIVCQVSAVASTIVAFGEASEHLRERKPRTVLPLRP
jgi:hypothetical protein